MGIFTRAFQVKINTFIKSIPFSIFYKRIINLNIKIICLINNRYKFFISKKY